MTWFFSSPSTPSVGRGHDGPSACPPFDPAQMERALRRDTWVRSGVTAALLVTLLTFQSFAGVLGMLLFVMVMLAWFAVGMISQRVAVTLPQIARWQLEDPPSAEAAIAQGLAQWPLHRSIRLGLYHQLAILRHGQLRIDESSAIAQALLSGRLGPLERHRPALLLMLAEARLLCHDLAGAYGALHELGRHSLTMAESLRHLALRTRYEVMAGHDQQALADLPRKLRLAELLPADPCGEVHALWAIAAARQQDGALHDWLRRRAELLADPEQLEHFRQGRLAFGVQRMMMTLA